MKRDIAFPTVVRIRMDLCRMNGVPIVPDYRGQFMNGRRRYLRMRLELAKRVLANRAEEFADDPVTCQAVLDTIDALFQARG